MHFVEMVEIKGCGAKKERVQGRSAFPLLGTWADARPTGGNMNNNKEADERAYLSLHRDIHTLLSLIFVVVGKVLGVLEGFLWALVSIRVELRRAP